MDGGGKEEKNTIIDCWARVSSAVKKGDVEATVFAIQHLRRSFPRIGLDGVQRMATRLGLNDLKIYAIQTPPNVFAYDSITRKQTDYYALVCVVGGCTKCEQENNVKLGEENTRKLTHAGDFMLAPTKDFIQRDTFRVIGVINP